MKVFASMPWCPWNATEGCPWPRSKRLGALALFKKAKHTQLSDALQRVLMVCNFWSNYQRYTLPLTPGMPCVNHLLRNDWSKEHAWIELANTFVWNLNRIWNVFKSEPHIACVELKACHSQCTATVVKSQCIESSRFVCFFFSHFFPPDVERNLSCLQMHLFVYHFAFKKKP